MAIVNIESYHDFSVRYWPETGEYAKDDPCTGVVEVGLIVPKDGEERARGCFTFSLANLPLGANVIKVRVRFKCILPGAEDGEWAINPYNGDGQADPCTDPPATCYERALAPGVDPYVVPITEFRTAGVYWFTLGDGAEARACIDVENAKTAVNRFALGLVEVTDLRNACKLGSCYHDPGTEERPLLEITYTVPPVGYQYSDGLVTVRVG